jgi:hypothetical protein
MLLSTTKKKAPTMLQFVITSQLPPELFGYTNSTIDSICIIATTILGYRLNGFRTAVLNLQNILGTSELEIIFQLLLSLIRDNVSN